MTFHSGNVVPGIDFTNELPEHDAEGPSLSLLNRTLDTIETRKIAILVGDGGLVSTDGVVTRRGDDIDAFAEEFVDAIAEHRH